MMLRKSVTEVLQKTVTPLKEWRATAISITITKMARGSGIFVSPPLSEIPKDGREGNISNPRVLSDMGLAIPRPTRLGDPRSLGKRFPLNIILTSLLEDTFFISSLFKATFLRAEVRIFLLHVARSRYPFCSNKGSSLPYKSLTFSSSLDLI